MSNIGPSRSRRPRQLDERERRGTVLAGALSVIGLVLAAIGVTPAAWIVIAVGIGVGVVVVARYLLGRQQ
jgi:hypothetical protein